MSISIPKDGAIRFEWSERNESSSLLLIRTGAMPGYMRVKLAGEVNAYQFERRTRAGPCCGCQSRCNATRQCE